MIKDYLKLLGHKGKDRVTGMTGVITSVCFDLYGCVQVDMRPDKTDKDGKLREGYWFDHKRIEITSKNPVLAPPSFEETDKPTFAAPGKERGAADHSTRRA